MVTIPILDRNPKTTNWSSFRSKMLSKGAYTKPTSPGGIFVPIDGGVIRITQSDFNSMSQFQVNQYLTGTISATLAGFEPLSNIGRGLGVGAAGAGKGVGAALKGTEQGLRSAASGLFESPAVAGAIIAIIIFAFRK